MAHLDRPAGLSFEDTVPVMHLAEQRIGCHVGIGPMPAPPGQPTVRMQGLSLEMILLVAPDGRLLNVVAARGPCEAIRDYARALIATRYRGKVHPPAGAQPAWYRVRLGFRWE